MLDRSKDCWKCGSKYHQAWQCPTTRKPMARGSSQLRQHKPIATIGKQGKKTAAYVERWKRTQKPNHAGFYTCYIGGDWVPYLEAEHPYSKARHPDKRTNQTLEPVCAIHNKLKGSMDITDFLEKYPQYKATVKKKYLKSAS